MKLFLAVILLILEISSGFASTEKSHKKVLTILDNLKPGFDTIYKYEENVTVSHQNIIEFEGQTFDVHLRKSTQNDTCPRKFVMHLDNVVVKGKHDKPPMESDLKAMSLPIVVTLAEDELDLDVILATESDTNKSLLWKHDALILLLHNMTEQVTEFDDVSDESPLELELDDMAYGKCNMTFTVTETKNDTTLAEFTTSRKNCDGQLHTYILSELAEYNVTDVQNESDMKFEFVFDKKSGEFLSSHLRMEGKIKTTQEIAFSIDMKVKFDGFKEAKKVFDETKNVKMYKEADLDQMF